MTTINEQARAVAEEICTFIDGTTPLSTGGPLYFQIEAIIQRQLDLAHVHSPTLTDCIRVVERLRDEWAREATETEWTKDHYNERDLVAAEMEAGKKIITALRTLEGKAVVSEQVHRIVSGWASSNPDAICDLDALCRIAEVLGIEVQARDEE